MSGALQMFIADLLHRRGIDDRDGFSLRAVEAIAEATDWDESKIKVALSGVKTDLFRRNATSNRTAILDLLASGIAKRWRSSPFETGKTEAKMIKILFVSSNPVRVVASDPHTGSFLTTMPLNLDGELRAVKEKLRSSTHRESFELISYPAARPDDLLQAFNQERPQIVHFSGHGTDTDEIVMLDENSDATVVPKTALESLFKVMKNEIRVVVLNACFSEGQAAAITKHIDCAVGMKRKIGDQAAVRFAGAFYRALGYGVSVQNAFDQGIVALQLDQSGEDSTPTLITRKGISASKISLVTP